MSTKPILMLGEDTPAMQRLCNRIAARRQSEANTLPAPPDWRPMPMRRPSLFLRCLWAVLLVVHLAAWLFALALHSTAQQP